MARTLFQPAGQSIDTKAGRTSQSLCPLTSCPTGCQWWWQPRMETQRSSGWTKNSCNTKDFLNFTKSRNSSVDIGERNQPPNPLVYLLYLTVDREEITPQTLILYDRNVVNTWEPCCSVVVLSPDSAGLWQCLSSVIPIIVTLFLISGMVASLKQLLDTVFPVWRLDWFLLKESPLFCIYFHLCQHWK